MLISLYVVFIFISGVTAVTEAEKDMSGNNEPTLRNFHCFKIGI